MDIFSIKPSTATVDIRHPATQEPIGLTIRLLPMSDKAVKAVQRRNANELYRARGMKITAEKAEANRLDILVAAVEGWEWSGDASFNGEKLECTPENVRKVLKVDWLREQVDEALGDDASFFGN